MPESVDHVHLKGAALSRARRHAMLAQDELLSLAGIVLRELSSKTSPDHIAEIRLRPNNVKVIYTTETADCVAVYEDPPGICRPCVDGG